MPKRYQSAHLWEAEAIHHHWVSLNALREQVAAAPQERAIREASLKRALSSYLKGKRLRQKARSRF